MKKNCSWLSILSLFLSLLFPLMTYNCFDKDSVVCVAWPDVGNVTRISFSLMQCRVLTGVQLCGWWQLWLAFPFMLSWVLTAFKVAKRRWQPRPTRGSVTSTWNLGAHSGRRGPWCTAMVAALWNVAFYRIFWNIIIGLCALFERNPSVLSFNSRLKY